MQNINIVEYKAHGSPRSLTLQRHRFCALIIHILAEFILYKSYASGLRELIAFIFFPLEKNLEWLRLCFPVHSFENSSRFLLAQNYKQPTEYMTWCNFSENQISYVHVLRLYSKNIYYKNIILAWSKKIKESISCFLQPKEKTITRKTMEEILRLSKLFWDPEHH